ncbi:UDP-N-acetylglucosamine 1-carboxyvinyltransferase [Syntrophobotulus glycolicus DSM 8271]|uniref:UDP-N-acetylglucosamine 1-carboxyvinyltransferase n=1 Tax=Syntrophobotulus glycolicus (strain DSM 8271 / FlGlyR) TaxID=645991 RepID=F0T2A3_SYNGF|nr:UDP-N-acetylglucosamine 1-carboxyvinyltransferase [Syntrophobotulus glycolicus DSM 8271]
MNWGVDRNLSKFRIIGGKELEGKIDVSGAKNAVLPIIAACLLTKDKVVLEEVPDLLDVQVMCQVIEALGGKIKRNGEKLTVSIKDVGSVEAPFDLISKMRASIFIMGPMLARKGRVRISHPGGCAIGSRPINWHIKGLEAMGAEIRMDHGFLDVSAPRLKGTRIYFDFPSVGATENIMMAAVCAEGTTIIENAAQEPEIVDLATFINQMGGKIRGAGTNIIKIEGVKEFHGTTHTVIPDRIEAGTYILMAAACGGEVLVRNVIPAHLKPLLAKLDEAGVIYREEDEGIRVIGKGCFNAVDIKTQVHPGFPTDLQAPFLAMLTRAKGTSVVTETVFENRYMHVDELKRMGADIKIEGRSAIIQGVETLNAATVVASDLRAGASLVLAALTSGGVSEIRDIYHIDRGYENLEDKLKNIGAEIERID